MQISRIFYPLVVAEREQPNTEACPALADPHGHIVMQHRQTAIHRGDAAVVVAGEQGKVGVDYLPVSEHADTANLRVRVIPMMAARLGNSALSGRLESGLRVFCMFGTGLERPCFSVGQKVGLALAVLAAVWLPALAPGQSLSFEQAWQRLEEKSPAVAADKAAAQHAQAAADEASARLWPELSVDARATRMNAPLELRLDPVHRLLGGLGLDIPPGMTPLSLELQRRQFYNLGLNAVWPLYAGGKIRAGMAAADAAFDAAQAGADAGLADLRLTLFERYFAQVLAEEALAVHEQARASLERHHADAQLMQEEGQVATAEVLRAAVALAEAERDVQTARLDLQLAREALAALLGWSEPIQTDTQMPLLVPAPNRDRLKSMAVHHNPALVGARAQRRRAEAGWKAARAERLPQVAAFARHELYTRDLTLLDPDWAVGVSVSMPLFDGARRRSAESAALARLDEADARIEAGETDIGLLVEQALQKHYSARARFDSFVATGKLAEESLRAQQLAFAEGFATSRDVVDAQLALSRVRLGKLAARYEALLALAAAWQAGGHSEVILDISAGHAPAVSDVVTEDLP